MGWVVNIKNCRETNTHSTDTHHIWIMTSPKVLEKAKTCLYRHFKRWNFDLVYPLLTET